jgi:hypothetical protein
MRQDELNQRSGFQFEIIKLNLVANGAIIAFALNKPEDWAQALVACPFISFILFSLWFHHALAIRLASSEAPDSSRVAKESFPQILRRWSFVVSMFGNFFFIPLSAIILHRIEGYYNWLVYIGIFLLVLIIILFGIWFYFQYHKEKVFK